MHRTSRKIQSHFRQWRSRNEANRTHIGTDICLLPSIVASFIQLGEDQMKKIRRIFLWGLAGLAGFITLAFLTLCLIYPPEFVYRCLTSGNESAHDYLDFPTRPLHASTNVFYFIEQPDEAGVRAIFESNILRRIFSEFKVIVSPDTNLKLVERVIR